MMNPTFFGYSALVLLVVWGIALPVNAESDHAAFVTLEFTTEEYPPFNYRNEDGEIDGISTRVVQEALRLAGSDANIRMLPWARALTEARFRSGHCVYSTSRSPDREEDFRWVGPLATNQWTVFARWDQVVEVNEFDDLRRLRVGGFREDAIAEYVASRGIDVLLTTKDRENLQRLNTGLIDVWITGSESAEILSEDAGVKLQPLYVLNETDLYLACHPDVPAAQLAALQSAIEQMQADGTISAIRANVYNDLSERAVAP